MPAPGLRKIRRLYILALALMLLLGILLVRARFWPPAAVSAPPVKEKETAAVSAPPVKEKKTVADRVRQFGDGVRSRLAPDFERIGMGYPPKRVRLVGLKQEKQLEVWVSEDGLRFRHLKTYPIRGASGTPGPKLREGDRQVPEGLYQIDSLNPNSLYHLALRLNYPNEFDRAKGRADGRENLGGDIMIHGKSGSIGCLAMGDEAAEDLFILAAETGISGVSVLISPVDFRMRDLPPDLPRVPPWTAELYGAIRAELARLKKES